MGERSFEGKLVDDRDGYEAVASDTFHAVKITLGSRGDEFTMSAGEAESFAKWILKIHPYGHRTIT
jgi:hypothetical protein